MERKTKPNSGWPRAGLCSVVMLLAGASFATAQDFAPLPEAPEINQARADLGAMLFFDSRLSGDTGHSCSSCHDPATGWTTGDAMSDGYGDLLYFRNAPSLFNVSSRNYLMWDGRLDGADLGTLVRDMLTESHTMHMDSRMAQERLKQVPEYAAMFEEGFGGDPYGGKIYGAIAEYIKTIRTVNAPFDAFLKGDEAALSDEAKRGMELFSGKAGCGGCHSGAMLSDGALHATGAPDHPELVGSDEAAVERQITYLRHLATLGTPNYMNMREDVGHYAVTKDEADMGAFVTPSLWDVGQTAPYMHSGALASLADVVAFYSAGNDKLPALDLTDQEQADLVAFLESLTGDAQTATEPELPDYALREAGQN